MTIKTLLFALFLFVCLVWLVALKLHPGEDFVAFGLSWTIGGFAAVLAFIVGARVFGWWRLWRAKAAVRPVVPSKPTPIVHEDEAALSAALAEANAILAKVPEFAPKRGRSPLSGMPLYVLIGPEGAGKTSTFVNSGLEPRLLAGQVTGTVGVVPTRLCNLWLAKSAIFAEISGRAFSGDLERWTRLLAVLLGIPPTPWWRRLSGEFERGLTLRGVIGFCDVKDFIGNSTPQLPARQSRDWQERLLAISKVFGVRFPVYLIVTKCDRIQFFPDFFRRLPDPEANQVLGCTLPILQIVGSRPVEAGGEEETKRLVQSFRSLSQALARRRITHLAHEPDPVRRPGIYEFPREMKRIRSPLTQFLIDVFRPNPLQPGPILRGYYLTGIREMELAAAGFGESRVDWSGPKPGGEATRLFTPAEASRLLRPENPNPSGAVRSGSAPQWMFTSDLLSKVILADRDMQKPAPADPRPQLYRRGALAAVCGVCVLFSVAFSWSCAGNHRLLQGIETAAYAENQNLTKTATLAELQSLETLRDQIQLLTNYERDGAPWSLRWGLYSGNRLADPARNAYFRRFQQLVLNDLNGALVDQLQKAPPTPGVDDHYENIYRLLKTYLMVSSGTCKPEPALVSRVLKETRDEAALFAGPREQALVDKQIDFYANELPYGNPCRLTEQPAARERARQYLLQFQGVNRIYQNILASAGKTLTTPQRLSVLAKNYAEVLKGQGEVSAVFTKEGFNFVEKAAKEGNAAGKGESCVLGETGGLIGEWKQGSDLALGIRRLFVRDYVNQWRNFVAGFSIARYGSADDAARKLEILADRRSPLLALFAMTSDQTSFPAAAAAPSVVETVRKKVPLINRVISGASKAEKAVTPEAAGAVPEFSSLADISDAFQPVQWVVPPGSKAWIGEKNSAYIEALVKLGRSMQEIARASGNPDPAVYQAARQSYDSALDAARQIAKNFRAVGVEGLDTAVQKLLEQPILLADPLIPKDGDKAAAAKLGNALHAFCNRLHSATQKYPFQQSGQDISLQDLAAWFAPGSGEIWKFQAQSIGELTVKDGTQWKPKDPAKKPQVAQELLSFLNKAQGITDAFYPAGATQLQLTYVLRPKLDTSWGNAILELEVDGRPHQWTTSLQKQFTWPAPPGTKDPGAKARVRKDTVAVPVASRGGLWGIFRIMGDAEPRPLLNKVVEWKYLRGGDGRSEPIQPPVRLEIVEFPGGADVFNPKFFEGFQCPAKAVQ